MWCADADLQTKMLRTWCICGFMCTWKHFSQIVSQS